MENDPSKKPLTIREYIGAFLPPKEKSKEDNDEDRSLTIREHIGAVPNIYEMFELIKEAGKGALRFINKNRK